MNRRVGAVDARNGGEVAHLVDARPGVHGDVGDVRLVGMLVSLDMRRNLAGFVFQATPRVWHSKEVDAVDTQLAVGVERSDVDVSPLGHVAGAALSKTHRRLAVHKPRCVDDGGARAKECK